jgi:hypothetical protein
MKLGPLEVYIKSFALGEVIKNLEAEKLQVDRKIAAAYAEKITSRYDILSKVFESKQRAAQEILTESIIDWVLISPALLDSSLSYTKGQHAPVYEFKRGKRTREPLGLWNLISNTFTRYTKPVSAAATAASIFFLGPVTSIAQAQESNSPMTELDYNLAARELYQLQDDYSRDWDAIKRNGNAEQVALAYSNRIGEIRNARREVLENIVDKGQQGGYNLSRENVSAYFETMALLGSASEQQDSPVSQYASIDEIPEPPSLARYLKVDPFPAINPPPKINPHQTQSSIDDIAKLDDLEGIIEYNAPSSLPRKRAFAKPPPEHERYGAGEIKYDELSPQAKMWYGTQLPKFYFESDAIVVEPVSSFSGKDFNFGSQVTVGEAAYWLKPNRKTRIRLSPEVLEQIRTLKNPVEIVRFYTIDESTDTLTWQSSIVFPN